MAKTKKEKYNEILNYIKDNAELTEFVNAEIEKLEKNNTNRKPTERQLENDRLAVIIASEFERLKDKGFITQKEFRANTTSENVKALTPQRLTPILNKLVAQNVLVKVQNTKKEYAYGTLE